MTEIEILQQWVNESQRIVFFGGAGVSTESGIKDFRSPDGIYHQKYPYPPETILSHTFFLRKTEEFYQFYRDLMLANDVKPNAAHETLARWEKEGKLTAVITQNIDGLHQAAGSQNVLELHGSIHRNYCDHCHKFYGLDAIQNSTGIPRCSCGGIIKPDVVLYEESLNENTINRSLTALREADLLIIGGTSLVVYPAAGFIQYYGGKRIVVINKTPLNLSQDSDVLNITAPIGATLSQIK